MAIDCCITVNPLARNIHAFLDINVCEQTVSVGIEQFQFEFNLIDYEFGIQEHFWLQKIFRIE